MFLSFTNLSLYQLSRGPQSSVLEDNCNECDTNMQCGHVKPMKTCHERTQVHHALQHITYYGVFN